MGRLIIVLSAQQHQSLKALATLQGKSVSAILDEELAESRRG